MLRLLIILATLVAVERAASACCLGCACTKYKDQPERVVEEPALGYTHTVRGGLPKFSEARIAAFLATGTWTPIPSRLRYTPTEGSPIRYVRATAIQFTPATNAGKASRARPVLIRRIEKSGSAILVEVNERTFKLAACPGKRGYSCLVDPGGLALQPIPPPGAPPADGFAKPPR